MIAIISPSMRDSQAPARVSHNAVATHAASGLARSVGTRRRRRSPVSRCRPAYRSSNVAIATGAVGAVPEPSASARSRPDKTRAATGPPTTASRSGVVRFGSSCRKTGTPRRSRPSSSPGRRGGRPVRHDAPSPPGPMGRVGEANRSEACGRRRRGLTAGRTRRWPVRRTRERQCRGRPVRCYAVEVVTGPDRTPSRMPRHGRARRDRRAEAQQQTILRDRQRGDRRRPAQRPGQGDR